LVAAKQEINQTNVKEEKERSTVNKPEENKSKTNYIDCRYY
jgi:hypothetical protein